MEFPRLVYRSSDEHMSVASAEKFDQAIKSGWFASVPDALGTVAKTASKSEPDQAQEDDNRPPTREEMEHQAKMLGIKFDGRTGNAKLARLIAEEIAI